VSDYTIISCEVGTIAKILSTGIFELGSEAENHNLCDSRMYDFDTGLNCSGISENNHPVLEKLETCIGE
jgi:hypothetical protein